MPKIEFSAGVAERHHVEITISFWTGALRAKIDGKDVPATDYTQSVFAPDFTLPRRTFTFGERERHKVEIKVDYRFVFPRMSTYLDGAPLNMAPNVTQER